MNTGGGGGGAVQFHFWCAELDSTPVSELSKGGREKKAEEGEGRNNQSKIHSETAAGGRQVMAFPFSVWR